MDWTCRRPGSVRVTFLFYFFFFKKKTSVKANSLTPFRVYITRQVITAFFNWRIESVTSRLQGQQDERTRTIQKLKDATKYNSTLELLEKYGGEPKKDRQADDDGASTSSRAVSRPVSRQEHRQQHRQQQGRTNLPPPPTANIQRRESANRPVTPNLMEPGAEFAPNAEFSPSQRGAPLPLPSGFDTSSLQGITSQQRTNSYPGPQFTQYEQPSQGGPQWYDRFLDLLLGEDEMAPRNRIALVCARCRLVNGQAAPGTKSLSEVGMWRCMGCGAMNGEADEGKKIIKELMEEKEKERKKKLATATTSYSRGEAVVEDEEANENRRMKDRGDLAT